MVERGVNFNILDNLPEELVKAGLVTSDQLAIAQVTQKSMGGDLGHILIKKGFVSEEQLLKFVADTLKVPFISLADITIDPTVVKVVPLNLVQKYHFMPLVRNKEAIVIAMADPLDLFALDEIKSQVKSDLEPRFTSKEEIDAAVNLHYH